MSHHKYIRFLAAVAFGLSFTAEVAPADDSPGKKETVQPRVLEATIRNGETIGWEQVWRVFVTCGTNEFVFVTPNGSRIDADPAMMSVVPADFTDLNYSLTFRILSAVVAETNSGNLDFYRELVFNRFPGAKIMEEYSKTAAGHSGLVFDLRVRMGNGVERAVCVALIPSAAGVLEFTLTAETAKLADARNVFNTMLRTFRSNENGKLEISPRVLTES